MNKQNNKAELNGWTNEWINIRLLINNALRINWGIFMNNEWMNKQTDMAE